MPSVRGSSLNSTGWNSSRDLRKRACVRTFGRCRHTSAELRLGSAREAGNLNGVTFQGFCSRHDSDLFAPIDRSLLTPTNEQAALYAYRALCRGIFLKENALALVRHQLQRPLLDRGARQLWSWHEQGTSLGLVNLMRHKAFYDEALRLRAFDEWEYTLFTITPGFPNLAFTGGLFPEFDFAGKPLQRLVLGVPLDLLTMSSALVDGGWGLLVSWHKSSSTVCGSLLRSLATAVHEGADLGDALFGLVIKGCENIAAAPRWWEQLSVHQREAVLAAFNTNANTFAAGSDDFPAKGVGGFAAGGFQESGTRPEERREVAAREAAGANPYQLVLGDLMTRVSLTERGESNRNRALPQSGELGGEAASPYCPNVPPGRSHAASRTTGEEES